MAEASRGVKFEAAKKEFLCVTSPSLPRPSIVPCIDPNPHAFILLTTIQTCSRTFSPIEDIISDKIEEVKEGF